MSDAKRRKNVVGKKQREQVRNFFARAEREGRDKALMQNYAGLPTFMRAPYDPTFSNCDIAMFGVPLDQGVVDRPGARFGPRSIRINSELASGPMNHATGIVPFELCRIVDGGDVMFENLFALDPMIDEIYQFYAKVHAAGVAPLTAGGDHSATYPILKAVAADEPVGLVHFDAHSDCASGEYGGSRYHNGTPFYNAVEEGYVDPHRIVQMGIRGRHEPHWRYAQEKGFRMIHAEEFFETPTEDLISETRKVVGRGPVYITVDVDALDTVYAPGTGEPEPGGLNPFDVQKVIRGLQGLHIVGGDVMEVSPPFDHQDITARYAATIMFEILCVLAESVAARK